jgi:hypothetical protein
MGRQADIPFSEVVKEASPIVPQIEHWAKNEHVDLYDGGKFDIARDAKRRTLAQPSAFTDDVLGIRVKLSMRFWQTSRAG